MTQAKAVRSKEVGMLARGLRRALRVVAWRSDRASRCDGPRVGWECEIEGREWQAVRLSQMRVFASLDTLLDELSKICARGGSWEVRVFPTREDAMEAIERDKERARERRKEVAEATIEARMDAVRRELAVEALAPLPSEQRRVDPARAVAALFAKAVVK